MSDGETEWLIEETWSGYVHYVHRDFNAAAWRAEAGRVRQLSRRKQRFITKNVDEALRFPTEQAADAWRAAQPIWFARGDQFQVREHMWPSPEPKEATTPDANPLPGPFCGGHQITLIRRSNVHGAMGCDDCGAEGPAGQYTEAVAVWNGRAVPAGWKLAPIEPTQEMVSAGEDVLFRASTSDGSFSGDALDTFSAMLSAAPEPPTAPNDRATEDPS